ncbi:hypothetical protein SAMN05444515_11754 [Ectothiorhodospira marina]|uniref:Uncharacterized protein n=1 Tax=Ectothiorhodospira marina TaxID=1396821 RepID=A0A1H7QG27_9GAMM|nr:hypothetical protein SAMN05444515_11754 [Ectothiorhodospira marina]
MILMLTYVRAQRPTGRHPWQMNLLVSSIHGWLRIRHDALNQSATLKSMEAHKNFSSLT